KQQARNTSVSAPARPFSAPPGQTSSKERTTALPIGDGPLIVQSDKTVLLEIDHPKAQDARNALAPFAELERAPEHVHTYRITSLALWNARAAGHDAEEGVHVRDRKSGEEGESGDQGEPDSRVA